MTRWLAEWPPRVVARLPIKVYTKLLAAFLVIVMLLIALGAVSLQVLSRSNLRQGTGRVPEENRRLPPTSARHNSLALQRCLGPLDTRRANA